MDDCTFDYYSAAKDPKTGRVREHVMWDKDFFLNLKPMPGAQGAIFDLQKLGFDLYFVSQPLVECPASYTDKALAVQHHFPQLYKKIILTQDKSLIRMDYLIDDNADKWEKKFKETGGTFLHFPYGGYNGDPKNHKPPEQLWRDLVLYFQRKIQL